MNLGISPEDVFLTTGMPSTSPDLPLPSDPDEVYSPFSPSAAQERSQPTRLGPFCRTAEASAILGHVLEFVSRTASSKKVDFELYAKLDKALQSIAMDLLQKATNGWEECCAAIGICFR